MNIFGDILKFPHFVCLNNGIIRINTAFWRQLWPGIPCGDPSVLSNYIAIYVFPGTCLTTDLDCQLHMNNSRYLRHCDFGRMKLWMLSGVWDAVRKLSGHVTMGASTIRYRKSLQLGQRYTVKTKVMTVMCYISIL